jgi:1-acyl-sn-glycerol-3-phosphate acyltransferase
LSVAWLLFPNLNEVQQRKAMCKWSRELLAILAIRTSTNAFAPLPSRCMLVSNHISWVDIFALAAQFPAIFVAKSEIRRWPLVGALCERAGTIFIERGRHSSARHTNSALSSAIIRGALISIFPEGTTTEGHDVGHFHAALFQAAIDSQADIQPAVIRYLDMEGNYCSGPNFVGETTFFQSLWNITAERRILAKLQVLAPLPSISRDRRSLAEEARAAIQNVLNQQSSRAPETSADLRALSR